LAQSGRTHRAIAMSVREHKTDIDRRFQQVYF